MADGQSFDGGFSSQMGIIIQDLVRREVARVVGAVGEIAIGDGATRDKRPLCQSWFSMRSMR